MDLEDYKKIETCIEERCGFSTVKNIAENSFPKYHAQMQERFKDLFYISSLSLMKAYWRIMKPITHGARILLVSGDYVLLVRHRRRTAWNLPGGGISLSEDPATGALRELYEETRIKFNAVDYCLGTYCAKSEGKRDTVYVFVKTIPEKIVPICSLEIQEAKWFLISDLPEHLSKATGYRIEEYQKGLRNLDGFWIVSN